jgi:hypothetical protein
MIERIINRYIENVERLRESAVEIERYEFKLSADGKRDENQLNRLRIAVGLLNDLKIPDDYGIIKRLLSEQVKQISARIENDEFDVIYLLYYLISEFEVIEDIWGFAELKFDGTMDSDSGFETGFFLTYGKENLRYFLQNSTHKLKDKIHNKVFSNEAEYSDSDGQRYKEQQKAYFGLTKPLKDEPGNYLWIREKEGFEESFRKWKESTDLSNEWNAHAYIRFSEYLGDDDEIEKAMINFANINPKDWLSEKYRKQMKRKQIRQIIQKISDWFK